MFSRTRTSQFAPAEHQVELSARATDRRTVAVLVMHGMGQQVPFATLDSVAQGLLHHPGVDPTVTARAIQHNGETLNRLEMRVAGDTERDPLDVHLYEAYWAPLTEGKITLRNVIGFLAGAGINGVRNATSGTFRRWVMGRARDYPLASRTLVYLIVALGAIGALVALNTAIALVAGGSLLGQRASWVTTGLVADLTTTFNAVLLAMLFAGIPLFAATKVRARYGRGNAVLTWLSAAMLTIAIAVIIVAGAVVPVLFYGHVRGGMSPGARMWTRALDPLLVNMFDARAGTVIAAAAGAIAAVVVLSALWRLGTGVIADVQRNERGSGVYVGFTALVVLIAAITLELWDTIGAAAGGGIRALLGGQLVWLLLVAASAAIRNLLVQYLGDVAIYVMPYRLDAFAALRKQIKECALRVGRAVYANPAYDKVVVVGHSLGSVVAYDMLNQLILEDARAASRTSMLLTFGSPLDKTAFIFSLQGRRTSDSREALAGTRQPLVVDYALRPDAWVNVHSPWDIISGGLDFYDPPSGEQPRGLAKEVENVPDPRATTPLVAHNEYWLPRTVLWDRLVAHLQSLRITASVRPGPGAPSTAGATGARL